MKRTAISTLVLAVATAGTGAASAADPSAPLTRAQVRAEYEQARRDGTLPFVDAEGTVIVPQRQVAAEPAHTRGEVKAEYFDARRDGSLPQYDGEGRLLNPPAVMGGPPVTRDQVKQELMEARRTGDIHSNADESGRTDRELFPKQYERREQRDSR